MTNIVVLGAGLAGLGAAAEAARLGADCLVIEAEPTAGGLARSVQVAGSWFDRYGPKILVRRRSSERLIAYLADNVATHTLRELVDLGPHGMVSFPVQRHLIELPEADRDRIMREILQARTAAPVCHSYRDWLLASYGSRLCDLVLFPYEEKKWQMSLSEMNYQWALSRPVSVSLEDIISGAQRRLPPSRTYSYPLRGTMATLVTALLEQVDDIRYESRVHEIDLRRKRISTSTGDFEYQHLISSIPLDCLLEMSCGLDADLLAAARRMLQWLGIRVYNLVFDGVTELDGGAIYFPDPGLPIRRAAIISNLCPPADRQQKTAISVEIPFTASSAFPDGHSLPEVASRLRSVPHFSKLGPLAGGDRADIDQAYPLQRDGLNSFVATVEDYLRHYNVWLCGRAGRFDYCDMDVAFQQGARAVREVI